MITSYDVAALNTLASTTALAEAALSYRRASGVEITLMGNRIAVNLEIDGSRTTIHLVTSLNLASAEPERLVDELRRSLRRLFNVMPRY